MAMYYKTIYTVEVLSDYPPRIMSLDELAHRIDVGEIIGQFNFASQTELTPEEMVDALDQFGIDVSFFPDLAEELGLSAPSVEDKLRWLRE